jgi:hypothetical protein
MGHQQISPRDTLIAGESNMPKAAVAPTKQDAARRKLAGIAGAGDATGFTIHIIDDAGDVLEIRASRENLELMITNLQILIGIGLAEDSHAQG